MKFKTSTVFLITLSLLNITPPSWSALPFSSKQKADIIERINICEQPIFEDGYETSKFKISIFQEQDGSFIYCGYDKKTKAKIILSAVKGEMDQNTIIWQAKSGDIVYNIKTSDEFSYVLSITKQSSIIYQAEAWSVYPP